MLKDVEDYFSKVNWRLNNTEFYKEILNDPTEANRKKVSNIINELKSARLWNKKIATKLEFQEEKTLEFYMLPNVHIQENLGRSVIGSINCSTSSTFRYVDHNPQPHVKKLKCCIKDSTDFIKKNEESWQDPWKQYFNHNGCVFAVYLYSVQEGIKKSWNNIKTEQQTYKGNYHILKINSYIKQFHLQLWKLFIDQRMRCEN